MLKAFAVLLFLVSRAAPLDVTIDGAAPIATSSPLLASHGWEAWQMLDALPKVVDPRVENIGASLSPGVVRVGGITGDWLRYIVDGGGAGTDGGAPAPPPALGGFWPSQPENITLSAVYSLSGLMKRSNLSLLFDLSELYGRNCNTTKPGCPSCTDWCGLPPDFPPWDMRNVEAFLQRLHDDGTAGGPGNPLFAFELGNELAGHLDPAANTADVLALSLMIKNIWADVPEASRPLFFAPSTDACGASYAQTQQIMKNITGHADGFTYHAYPAGDGHALEQQLLNASWLRSGILTGSDSQGCIDDWNAGPRAAGLQPG